MAATSASSTGGKTVVQSLQTGRGQRTQEDVDAIRSFILSNCRANIFKQITKENLNRLCRGVGLAKFDADQLIFKQGDASDSLLILIKGAFAVYRQEEGRNINVAGFGKFIVALSKPGEIVGEQGVMENMARNSSVLATAPSWFMRIDGQQSRSIIKKQLKNDLMQRMQQIMSLPYFAVGASEEFIRDLSRLLKSQTLRARDVIFRQGNVADETSFIVSGSIGLYTRNEEADRRRHPLVLVCYTGVGEILGGEALVADDDGERVHEYTAIAETTSDIFTLPRSAMRILDRSKARETLTRMIEERRAARRNASAPRSIVAASPVSTPVTPARSKRRSGIAAMDKQSLERAIRAMDATNLGLLFPPNSPCHRCRDNTSGIRPLRNRRLVPLKWTKDGLVKLDGPNHRETPFCPHI